MAMISTSKRNFYDYLNETNKKNKNTEGIGPGTYSPKPFDKSIAYKNVRPPPFNTQDQKWSPDKSALKSNIPGPGAYSVAGDMNKGRVIAINPEKGTLSLIFINDFCILLTNNRWLYLKTNLHRRINIKLDSLI